MSRPLREQVIRPGQPHHVVVRGNNQRRLFSYPRELRAYIWQLGRALEHFNVVLHAICLLANHIHLLSNPPSRESLSSCLKRVNQRYSQIRNSERGGTGKLFEQTFEAKPIESDDHLRNTILYIEANPILAGCQGCARYRWTTFPWRAADETRSEIPRSLIRFDPWYLSLGKSPIQRAVAYRSIFTDYVNDSLAKAKAKAQAEAERKERGRGRLLRPNGKSAR